MRRQIRFAGILAGLWSSVLVCSVDVLGQQAVSSMPRVATPGSMGQQVLSQAVPNDPGGLRVGFQSDERHLDACLQRPGLTLAAASDRGLCQAVLAAFSDDNTTIATKYRQHSAVLDYQLSSNIVFNATLYRYRPKHVGESCAEDTDPWLNRIRLNLLISS